MDTATLESMRDRLGQVRRAIRILGLAGAVSTRSLKREGLRLRRRIAREYGDAAVAQAEVATSPS